MKLDDEDYELLKSVANIIKTSNELALDFVRDDEDARRCKQILDEFIKDSLELLTNKMRNV